MKSKLFSILIILVAVIFSSMNQSCTKPENPKAVITILDESNQPVEGAEVTVFTDEGRVIYLKSGIKYSETALSDVNGRVSFEFMYEAIYNVKVLYKTGSGSHTQELRGTGVLLLKEDQTTDEKIKIRE